MIHKAEDSSDKQEKELLLEEGPQFQKQWNCPWSKEHDPKGEPDSKCKESFVPLSRLTKVPKDFLEEEIKTCPKACTSQQWISEGIRYYNWREKSQLQLIFTEGKMPQTVLEGIEAIEKGIRSYEKYLNDQSRLNLKKQQEELDKSLNKK